MMEPERKIVRRIVKEFTGISQGKFNLGEFIATLQKVYSEIPEEFQEDATLLLDFDNFYDAYEWELSIGYMAPETDKQLRTRLRQIEILEMHERKQLERLKAKYETNRED